MRRGIMKSSHQPLSSHASVYNQTALLLLSSGFFLGGVFGCIFASSVCGNGSLALSSYINEFIASIRAGTIQMPSVLSSIWSIFRWPIITVLLSFTAFGMIGIPVLFFIRGFLFTFCVSSFALVLGKHGLLYAFLLLGVESFLSIPVLFLIGLQGIALSAQAKNKKKRPKLKPYTNEPSVAVRNAICICVLLFCTMWEILFVPMLISGAINLFPV
jgi:hypothetical protein